VLTKLEPFTASCSLQITLEEEEPTLVGKAVVAEELPTKLVGGAVLDCIEVAVLLQIMTGVWGFIEAS
jgi:hypothetical protein